MIRLIGSTIIIPRGDTGTFMLPSKIVFSESNIAFFSVKDLLTKKTIIEKKIDVDGNFFSIDLKKEDTSHIEPGEYYWDIKIYYEPIFDEDNNIVDALEINSYYSAFKQPRFIIKEVAKDV